MAGLVLTAALAPLTARAATLAPDSLLCQSAKSLQFVQRRSELKSQPASVVIQRATATEQMFIRSGRSAAVRTENTPFDQDGFIGVATTCFASAGPARANVIERRASLGLARVQAVYQGRMGEYWVYAGALTE
jgi:hypothetical protein